MAFSSCSSAFKRPISYSRSESFSTLVGGTASWVSTNANDYLVTNLPNESEALTKTLNGQWAGYIPFANSKTTQNAIFFWYFKSMNTTSNKLTIWLNGGPGCSSLLGSFIENGPVKILDNGTLAPNEYSWHKQANVLYVEQPVNTGFSFSNGEPTRDESELNSDFYLFLDGFMKTFPEAQDMDLYITGESYAGVYIPYIALKLLEIGKFSNGKPVNLKGLGIGNGLYSRDIQESFASTVGDFDFLHDVKFFGDDTAALDTAGQAAQQCLTATAKNYTKIPLQCDMFDYAQGWLAAKDPRNFACLDIYNVHENCNVTSQREYQLAYYLNSAEVQKALHIQELLAQWTGVSKTGWAECSDTVSNYLDDRNLPDTFDIIPKILETGVPVTLYEGDLDFILHYINVERTIGNMT
ncbi:Cell death protease, partial [Blyttiomyces sp. JEL0837]